MSSVHACSCVPRDTCRSTARFLDTDRCIPDAKLSLAWQSPPDGLSHTLDLFQEWPGAPDEEWSGHRYLEIVTWFDELTILRPDYTVQPVEEFIAGGKRWWEAMYAGDPRVQGRGIIPLDGDA